MSSILNDVKKALDLDPSYKEFDQQVLMFINGSVSKLNQIGVGPSAGLYVQDDTTQWEELVGTDPRWNMVKPHVLMEVRLAFDPPGTSYAIDAIKTQLAESIWRLSVLRESLGLQDAAFPGLAGPIKIDGGNASQGA